VEEAVAKLQEVEGRFRRFHGSEVNGENGEQPQKKRKEQPNSKQAILDSLVERKAYKEGNLVHKTEPEVKTHTSYLVFAVLPMEWSEEEEANAAARWPVKISEQLNGRGKEEGKKKISNREAKRLAKEEKWVEREKRELNGGVDVKEVEETTVAENMDAVFE
jgi:tRNA (adenine57-N1/adenine58-N1)-methyltransferase